MILTILGMIPTEVEEDLQAALDVAQGHKSRHAFIGVLMTPKMGIRVMEEIKILTGDSMVISHDSRQSYSLTYEPQNGVKYLLERRHKQIGPVSLAHQA